MIESGRRPNVESATAVKLASVFTVSLDWLLMGKGELPETALILTAVERARQAAESAQHG